MTLRDRKAYDRVRYLRTRKADHMGKPGRPAKADTVRSVPQQQEVPLEDADKHSKRSNPVIEWEPDTGTWFIKGPGLAKLLGRTGVNEEIVIRATSRELLLHLLDALKDMGGAPGGDQPVSEETRKLYKRLAAAFENAEIAGTLTRYKDGVPTVTQFDRTDIEALKASSWARLSLTKADLSSRART